MTAFKQPKFGFYSPKTRLLQKKLSFEKMIVNGDNCIVYKYLGSRTNTTPSLLDLQDPILLENVDRAYDTDGVMLNCSYEHIPEEQMDLSHIGVINPLAGQTIINFHSYSFEADGLGRYMTVGDIIELPDSERLGVRAFFEVTDVDTKKENETYMVVVTTEPMKATQETEELNDMIVTDDNVMSNLQGEMEEYQDSEVKYDELDGSEYGLSVPTKPLEVHSEYSKDFLDDLDQFN